MVERFRLCLPRRLYREMEAQALAERPNECCGLLAGRLADGRGLVIARYPLVNLAASPTDYLSEPRGMFLASKDMRLRGLELLAIYHSHPTSPPLPSRKDLANNFYGSDVVHLILSLQEEQPLMRGWWLGADSFSETGWDWIGESDEAR